MIHVAKESDDDSPVHGEEESLVRAHWVLELGMYGAGSGQWGHDGWF